MSASKKDLVRLSQYSQSTLNCESISLIYNTFIYNHIAHFSRWPQKKKRSYDIVTTLHKLAIQTLSNPKHYLD